MCFLSSTFIEFNICCALFGWCDQVCRGAARQGYVEGCYLSSAGVWGSRKCVFSHLILLNLTFAALSSGGVIKCGGGRRDKGVWGLLFVISRGVGEVVNVFMFLFISLFTSN